MQNPARLRLICTKTPHREVVGWFSGLAWRRAGWLLRRSLLVALAVPSLAGAVQSENGSCSVAGTHATLQAAVLDNACATISVPAGDYPESVVIVRDVVIEGPAVGVATITGGVLVQGDGIVVQLHALTLDSSAAPVAGCVPRALISRGGARVTTNGVRVVTTAAGACIFADSFESSSTARWSAAVP